MNKKLRYPMEAFALALVLFSQGMKAAMIVGIALVFGDVLQCMLSDISPKKLVYVVSGIGAVITCAAMFVMFAAIGVKPEVTEIAGYAALGILLAKHNVDRQKTGEVTDYNGVLLHDTCAYGIYVLAAAIREYLAGAAIFETGLEKFSYVSASFGKPMFALIFAGIVIALLNRILDAESEEYAGLWVCIPAILLAVPFVLDNVPELLGTILGILMTGVIYLTFRTKLRITTQRNNIAGVPVETAMLGMIYMIFSLL